MSGDRDVIDNPELGRAIAALIEQRGWPVTTAASRIDVSRPILYEAMAGRLTRRTLKKLALAFQVPVEDLELAAASSGATGASPKNATGRPRLRPAPYGRVHEYLERMRDAGMPEPSIDEAERYLVDSNFGQLNKRDYRERSDDEVIMDIDAMWAALKIRFQRDYGVSL